MDDPYLLAAARCVELNPVRAKLVEHTSQWPWSSAKAHLEGSDDGLVKAKPLLARVGDWKAFLRSAVAEEELRDLREHGRTGRPLGSSHFLGRLESLVGRVLKRQKPGPKPQPRKPRTGKAAN
jgi:putative transposase